MLLRYELELGTLPQRKCPMNKRSKYHISPCQRREIPNLWVRVKIIGIRGGQIRTTISRTALSDQRPLSNSRAGSVELFTTSRLANPVSTPDPDRSTIPVPVQEFGAFSPALRTSRRAWKSLKAFSGQDGYNVLAYVPGPIPVLGNSPDSDNMPTPPSIDQ